jgi:ABC-type antimicrobial peptide transport system permease subunit
MNLIAFILRRAARHWQILLTLALGVVIATALLASAPVLVNTVIEFGLRRTILSADPLSGNLRLRAFGQITEEGYEQLDAEIKTAVSSRLGPYVNQVVPVVVGRWLSPWQAEQIVADQRVALQRYGGGGETDIREHAELVEGDWPAEPVAGDNLFQGVIGAEMAGAYSLAVGDRLPLSLERDESEPSYWLEVSGIARPKDGDDPYWFGEFSPLRAQSDERWSAQYAILVPPDTFFSTSETLFPNTNYDIYWHVLLLPERFTNVAIPEIQTRLSTLIAELRDFSPPVTTETRLNEVLDSFAAQANAVRAPLYFLTAEVVLLALYYVIMVAALSVRQVEREFAVLQSRGAAGSQIFQIQAGEALMIAALAFLSGPLLGVALVRGLTLAGPLADVSEAGWPLTLPQLAWITAAVGALACMIGLLLPVGPAVRRSIVSFQQETARNTNPPWWQRAYLDVIVLVIGLVLLWRLQLYGSLVGSNVSARPQVDWLLLLSPIALLIGAGTILLRIFPLLLNFLAALASRGRGLPGALALWQAARNPTHVARLVLLLTLAMALGILTTGINATLNASELERARYTAGSDVRLISNRGVLRSDLAAVPGVAAQSTTYRTNGSLSIGRAYLRFDVLGVDPESFAPLTTYREDFAPQPMPELLLETLSVEAPEVPALELPGRPAEFGLWIWSAPDVQTPGVSAPDLIGDSDLDRFGLQGRLRTALGDVLTVNLTPIEQDGYPADGWRYFRAEMPLLSETSYPLALESLWLRNRSRTAGGFTRQFPNEMELALDEITVVDAQTGQRLIADDWEGQSARWMLTQPDSTATISNTRAHSGSQSLNLQLDLGSTDTAVIRPDTAPLFDTPLPTLASPAFLASTEAAVGDILNVAISSQPVQVQIVGRVNYFPTLYEDQNAGFLVTNRDLLLGFMNSRTNVAVNANEALLAVAEAGPSEDVSAEAGRLLPGLRETWNAEALRRAIKADPMGLGLRSVTFFGYVLTTTLSLVGFATYFYLSARQRESLYSVLRSIGLSPGQLYGTLVLEQVVLILAGLSIGTLLGVLLNQLTLPGLPITFGDRPPTPPFIARNDWIAVGRIYLSLAVAFLICLGVATVLLMRTNLHRALRVGEE